jgi:transposase InsO family protein
MHRARNARLGINTEKENTRAEVTILGIDIAKNVFRLHGCDSYGKVRLRKQLGIHRSDQGSQYSALAFGIRCAEAGVRPSMGSVGDCFDNAMCESFLATLECELLDRQHFKTQIEARMAIFEFIEGWYNPHRRHSAINYLSPIDFEKNYPQNADYRSPSPSTEAG